MSVYAGLKFSSFDYYNSLFNHPRTNSVLLIDPNGIILDVNRAFLLSFGYEKEDIVGQNFAILFSEADRKKDLPSREINTVLDEGQSFDNNYLVNKDQSLTWVSGESLLIGNDKDQKCVLKIIQNIHMQKESEYSIVRLNNFNENILGSIEDAVIVLDKDLKILKANRSFLQIFNFADSHVAKIDFRQFIRSFDINDELYNIILSIFQSKLTTTKIQLELEPGEHSDRQTFDVSCSKLDEQGEQTRILLIFHNITSQRQIEKQREDILNFVAHEFRNPLTSVILNIELVDQMLREKELDEFQHFIDRARNNGQRLKKLINELYKSTKLISGNFDPDNAPFSFEDMIDEAIQSARQVYPHYNIVKIGNAPVTLFADRDKLMQVVTNYLTNAIKYSDDNINVEVETSLKDNSVVLAVKDYGRGIPKKDLPYIFNRFFRAEKTKDLEGLGLGLFLSRQIIQAHNGHTWVESEEGKGSCFYFSLPLPIPDPA
ncbi:MAG TPA: PAS domain-containing sensor histidine kinase [Puia sp.]|jgi:PAS domain S-box-containing protein